MGYLHSLNILHGVSLRPSLQRCEVLHSPVTRL